MTIKVENIRIRYIVGDFRNKGITDYILKKLKGEQVSRAKEFWAVDGVSFELYKGDFLGIIGNNGAGKSTLLKAISGVMPPTQGSVTVNGNIAALLELGTGFDGDLTVRENTFLRGALMGYTREFMKETYDDIIAFAELEDFQDMSFMQLSSGMKARLGFSIACLVRPEILILDEVLSVGDGEFREKSEKRMAEIIADGAITLFVSHSLGQVRKLCNKVLWLEKGKQKAFGATAEVCDMYEQAMKKKKKGA
ncbi:MAG: ABC transporter ATP-binding protein [Defluviitaleaceae bacterium]|nr:ABC transporter ATP-binding protein [Defluviitaleaceae bacterium]